MKLKVIIDFSRWRDANLDRDAQHIKLSMKDNPHFPKLADQVAAVETAADDFHEAHLAAINHGTEAHSRKDDLKKVLIKALRVLGFNINEEADGDRTLLESTGYPFAKVGGGRKGKDGPITVTAGTGSVTITLKSQPDAGSYIVQYTTMPVSEDSTWTKVHMVTTSLTLDGLAGDRKYAFRVAPVFHAQEPVFSEPVISRYVE